MRVVFLGTPEFAVPSLRALVADGCEVQAVISQPDRPSGRGQKLRPTPVKLCAEAMGIPVFQPARIGADESRALIAKFQPDFLVVVAYGQILPLAVLQLARSAAVNVHASLLPRYRGASPVVWAILNGEKITGVTTMIIEERLDAGPILLAREVPISPITTAGELLSQLSEIGAALLIQTLSGMSHGKLTPIPQDDAHASLAPRISKELSAIDWQRSATRIHDQIRALNPWPVAQTIWEGKPLKLLRSCPVQACTQDSAPGTLLGVSGEGILIRCGDASVLEVLSVQQPGRSRISGREFANGARLLPGTRFVSFTPNEEL